MSQWIMHESWWEDSGIGRGWVSLRDSAQHKELLDLGSLPCDAPNEWRNNSMADTWHERDVPRLLLSPLLFFVCLFVLLFSSRSFGPPLRSLNLCWFRLALSQLLMERYCGHMALRQQSILGMVSGTDFPLQHSPIISHAFPLPWWFWQTPWMWCCCMTTSNQHIPSQAYHEW